MLIGGLGKFGWRLEKIEPPFSLMPKNQSLPSNSYLIYPNSIVFNEISIFMTFIKNVCQ